MKKHKLVIGMLLSVVCISLAISNTQKNIILANNNKEDDEYTYDGDPFFLDEDSNVITKSKNDLSVEEYRGEDLDVSNYRNKNNKEQSGFKPFMMFRSFSAPVDTYGVVEEDTTGNKEVVETFDTYKEANQYYESEPVSQRAMIYKNNRVIKVQNGVVNFRTKDDITRYTEAATGRGGYTHGAYGADAAYIETSADGTQIKFMMSGVIGWVPASEVQLLNYDSDEVKSVNYYVSKDGTFYHGYTTNIKSEYYYSNVVGPSQDYLTQKVPYYSYDGHYFYQSYATMISDYRAETRVNAVNANNPYYNYYQFLSHRSKSLFTADDMNRYISSKTQSDSKLINTGQYFVDNQNKYGTNAAMMFGVAVNESAWGTSYFAKNRNNLFGHSAFDSSPDSASGYANLGESIEYHSKVFLSIGYFDPIDVSGRYFGAHLGDKSSGVNVKYASDPYWGEKSAAQSYALEKFVFGSYQKPSYKIGVIQEPGTTVNIRKEASTSSVALYQNKPIGMRTGSGSYPFVIIETVTGESVGGNNQWYKIQADPTLNDARTSVTQDIGIYNFNRDYAYVHSSNVRLVNDGVETPTKPEGQKLGDVNGDGIITAADYLMIKDFSLGKINLSEVQKNAADVNKDGNVTASDYLKIKDYLLGKISSLE